ncbi:MAG: HAD family hydrolase [Gemmataceae bacterium]
MARTATDGNRVRGVLLDVDGTLVDSNDAHARAWVRALADCGTSVHFEDVRPLIGMGGDKLLPVAAGIDADSPEGQRVERRRSEIVRAELLPMVRPFPRAADLLAALRARSLRLVVASSAKDEELDKLLDVCGAKPFVEARTSSDDADNSKPDPDIIHAALAAIGLPAGEVLMLGDTPYDVEAAGKAGVGVVAFRCGGWGDADLTGAVAVYDGPADLLANLDASPFGGSRTGGR